MAWSGGTNWQRNDGRLAAPLPLRVPGVGYYLVCRPEDRERADFVSLRGWLSARFSELAPLDVSPSKKRSRRGRGPRSSV